ncbi:MAG: anaerobic ribonucleoside-triphosphate reductase activating protein [Alphaproteobacteria bacterium]|nr:anaerobic ribonucleoside-triphosphate reductase activating protein [Alphaproteobacteria bacterium]
MSEIKVGGVEKFSAVDFPEKLTAVVFMQGCPWKCPFCHNASIRDLTKENDFSWDLWMNFLRSRIGKLDAVTFSGGEPLMQDCLSDAISEVKDLGYAIGLHTGGYHPKHLEKILPLVDWVGLDIKAPFETGAYQNIVGVNHLAQVEQSLDLLLQSKVDFECRTTCDPRFLTSNDLLKIAKSLQAKGVKKYFLQKYRPIETDKTTTDSDCENILANSELIEYCKNNFEKFEIRR